MREIKCPRCSKAFNLDDAGYADILKQVRDREVLSVAVSLLITACATHPLRYEIRPILGAEQRLTAQQALTVCSEKARRVFPRIDYRSPTLGLWDEMDSRNTYDSCLAEAGYSEVSSGH